MIFNIVVWWIRRLSDKEFDRLSEKVYRPAFTRDRELPVASGQTIQFFDYKALGEDETRS